MEYSMIHILKKNAGLQYTGDRENVEHALCVIHKEDTLYRGKYTMNGNQQCSVEYKLSITFLENGVMLKLLSKQSSVEYKWSINTVYVCK